MVETITLDSKTMLIKSDNENDLSEIITFLTHKDKFNEIDQYLKFAADNRTDSSEFKFNRNDCYDR